MFINNTMEEANHSIVLEWNPVQQYKGTNLAACHNVESHKHSVKKEATTKECTHLTRLTFKVQNEA